MQAQGLEVVGRGVPFVASKTVLRVDGVPFFHARIAMGLRQNRRGGDGNAARVALDERFLLDENIELHRVNEQIIRRNGELLQSGGHGLAAGLINVPGVDALGIDFRDRPSESMLANARGKFRAALRGKFLRIVEANDATLGIQNDGGGNDGPEESAATSFIQTGDAHPAKLSRRSFETGGAETAHCAEILTRWRDAVTRIAGPPWDPPAWRGVPANRLPATRR
jgi:hypothetical protein